MANRVFVTGDYFSTLAVNAAHGRLLTIADDEPGAPDGPVVVVGYRMWRDGLGGREDVVGLRLTVDAIAFTVVGIAPPDFRGAEVGRDVDLFAPQHLAPQMTSTPMDDDNAWLNVFVRLKAGMTSGRGHSWLARRAGTDSGGVDAEASQPKLSARAIHAGPCRAAEHRGFASASSSHCLSCSSSSHVC